MSWMPKLYETYENCQSVIGYGSDENTIPLLPICHTTQKAQIEIAIDQDGNFQRARVISKAEARTIIPCTESSGGRAGIKPETHPLCDKLQYIALDFSDYGGEVTKGYVNNPKEPFEKYHELLKKWCESEFSHPKAKAILKYIEKGHVIKDLVDYGILFIGSDGKMLKKWDKEANTVIPEIFKETSNLSQMNAFVRWAVEIPGDAQSAVWTDTSLYDSWMKYYLTTKENRSLCYVTGKIVPSADQHPFKLRNDGDKAKLISANDSSGFTFRGRFSKAEQACGVSFEVTQKAHNVLRWLIGRQAYRRGDQAIVAWATNGVEIPDPLADPFTILGSDEIQSNLEKNVSTAQDLALKLKNKISGYHAVLGNITGIVVMGLDSATPGRLSITFYRELTGSDFLNRIEYWHQSCAWIHTYHSKEIVDLRTGKKTKIPVRFVGAPAPSDIAEAAYGSKVEDKLRKSTVERILPCIIDRRRIPRDLVESAARRATNRVGMEVWEWNKTLSIACALYRKYYEKEEFKMALDEERKTRDYLYGRLLALADSLEEWALKESGEKRQTNAARLMQRFADHPYTTWRTLELALGPYKARLGNKSSKRSRLISEVIAMFTPDDFMNDRKLSGEFLLGYHCQREALRNLKKDDEPQIN
ncbi:type I-C CRISPR-associated protein Cas8c/Csd1 [Desulfitobacterium sp.]|uniref:type I-C CRISPR-associated protein Cas8c/Csd1 n=1 Tax=Desulfitobacterium sp. TaxID=49981 RepID=UPI002C60643D|nr:type I-C CRISPR-associated protein Cas8c/Csd1 [Desulfitobacterium sp.]HVJ48741.1 type I-C CRISPR-associated protein Cas8c/Csd1 [Desulfitobacterium sp.]